MKTLVVFYSRTGVTRKLAGRLAEGLHAEVEEIVDTKDRSGALGWLGAGRDAVLRRSTNIQQPVHDPAEFDLVLVGTPVWAGTMACAVRAWLERFAGRLPQTAFFVTARSKFADGALRHMAALSGREPVATLAMTQKAVLKDTEPDRIASFIRQLRPLSWRPVAKCSGRTAASQRQGRKRPVSGRRWGRPRCSPGRAGGDRAGCARKG